MTQTPHFDLAVIGGGVNGCGVARDAVGRGARTVLFEKGDLAGATSSASTKLIHGGLRYLEQYEFRLVREALEERAVLRRIAPHLTQPLRFILPHHEGLRPRWLLRIGLFLYDHLGGRGGLPAARGLTLTGAPEGAPLKRRYAKGFSYYDCQTDDARLVVLNAMDARARGADIRTRTEVTSARRVDDHWVLTARGPGGEEEIRANVLVNAAGPWVNHALNLAGEPPARPIRLVQGSHIVTRRLFDHDAAYLFQNADGRVVFAIPWQGAFTMIGTTDRDFSGDPDAAVASPEEVAYLCSAVDEYFEAPVTPADVVWTWSGVRSLVDDGASEARQATRDYVLHLDAPEGKAPLLSVYGGKITTYRRLAEAALRLLKGRLEAADRPPWTAVAALPGGDFPVDGLAALEDRLLGAFPFLTPAHARRLAGSYGTRAFELLEGARGPADLGEVFCSDLTAREVEYLMRTEFAETAEDVLFRRSKLNLLCGPAEAAALAAFMAGRRGGAVPAPAVPAGAAT